MKRKKLFRLSGIILMAVGLVVMLLVAGCAKPAPAPAPPPAADKYGGILRVGFMKAAQAFGYPVSIVAVDREYAGPCLQRLVQMSEEGAPEPQLALSWELAPDKTSYTFHLRKGVKFHDGTDFNAEAVKWNLDNVLESPQPVIVGATSVDVIDDYTVRLNLSKWNNLILNDLAVHPTGFMVSPTAVEKNGVEWAETHPVGTGPFKFKEYQRNVVVKYERFDDYWEEGLPYLDGLEFPLIPDPMTGIASLKAGEVQVLPAVDVTTASQLKSEGYFTIIPSEGPHTVLLINSKDPTSPFADNRLRQAVEYAIDKETICESLGYGYMFPVYEIIHSCPGDPAVPRKYDPDKARELLAEAGYPDGLKTKIMAISFAPRDLLGAIQGYLVKVGIDAELEILAPPVIMTTLTQGGMGNNLMMMAEPGGGASIYGILSGAYTTLASGSSFDVEMARTAGFDDLVDQAAHETDPDKITALLQQAESLAYDDAMLIPLFNEPFIAAIDPVVQGYEWFIGGGPDFDLSGAWLSEK